MLECILIEIGLINAIVVLKTLIESIKILFDVDDSWTNYLIQITV